MINWIRKRWTINNVRKIVKSAGVPLKVNSRCVFNAQTELGNNCNFNGMTVIGRGRVVIGNNFHSGQGCYIVTENHDYDNGNAIPYDSNRSIQKDVIIDDNVWIGVGVIILPGAHIHEGAIIQAGAVVSGEIPACSIAGGVPAKVFKMRDIDHYNTLKERESFF